MKLISFLIMLLIITGCNKGGKIEKGELALPPFYEEIPSGSES